MSAAQEELIAAVGRWAWKEYRARERAALLQTHLELVRLGRVLPQDWLIDSWQDDVKRSQRLARRYEADARRVVRKHGVHVLKTLLASEHKHLREYGLRLAGKAAAARGDLVAALGK